MDADSKALKGGRLTSGLYLCVWTLACEETLPPLKQTVTPYFQAPLRPQISKLFDRINSAPGGVHLPLG